MDNFVDTPLDTLEFSLPFRIGAAAAMQAFWRAERWPALTEHVRGIDFLYEDERIQVLTMRVHTRGSQAEFRTMRCRQRDRIYYFQPLPPPFLLVHGGWWQIREAGDDCIVTSHHSYRIEPQAALGFARDVLEWNGRGELSLRIGELLRANSLQTMQALQRALQRPSAAAA